MQRPKMADNEVFYVRTKDKTTFAIYDLTLSDDCDKISFGYNFIDENGLDKSHYEEEINAIVKQQVERAIKLEVADANLRENT
jgi:hypothetical protein